MNIQYIINSKEKYINVCIIQCIINIKENFKDERVSLSRIFAKENYLAGRTSQRGGGAKGTIFSGPAVNWGSKMKFKQCNLVFLNFHFICIGAKKVLPVFLQVLDRKIEFEP
jgi:hypothetical protein